MHYKFPFPSPWSSIVSPLGVAEDALSRLDERLRVSPIREGWIARTHFIDACASAWIDGELVHIETSSYTMRVWIFGRRPTN